MIAQLGPELGDRPANRGGEGGAGVFEPSAHFGVTQCRGHGAGHLVPGAGQSAQGVLDLLLGRSAVGSRLAIGISELISQPGELLVECGPGIDCLT